MNDIRYNEYEKIWEPVPFGTFLDRQLNIEILNRLKKLEKQVFGSENFHNETYDDFYKRWINTTEKVWRTAKEEADKKNAKLKTYKKSWIRRLF